MDDGTTALREALATRFALEREIGRGGMGSVLLAHDRRLGRDVAIKVLTEELSEQLGAERFEQEIRLTARLVHPNIVPLFDSGQAAGRLFFVMPFVDGGTLRQAVETGGPRPVAQVMRVLADLGEALAYAHGLGIVHRDVKPENVFWHGERALLADFGIATAQDTGLAGGRRLTGSGLIIGTLDYLSPEQASAGRQLDGRSDLYALGCMAYELLVGRPPFRSENPMAVLAGHLTTPAPSARAARPDVPPRLDTLILRLMAKSPDERPATAAAFLEDLRSIAQPAGGSGDHGEPARSPAADAHRAGQTASLAPDRMTPHARELHDKAVALFNGAMQGGDGTEHKLDMAVVYLEKALARDPDDPVLLTRLSDVQHVRAVRGFAEWETTVKQVKNLRMRILALDDSIGEVHSSLGVSFLYWEDDFELAGEELALGVRLGPGHADGRRYYGAWLKIAGRHQEALEQMRAAVQLAPKAPFMYVGLGDVLMAMGRYDEAAQPLREALRLLPRYEAALERLEMACHRAGRHDEALDARRTLLGIRGETDRMKQLEADVAANGWPAAREQDLRRELAVLLARAGTEDAFLDQRGSRQLSDRIIIVLAELGEWPSAMDWVERSYHRRPGRLRRVLNDLPYDHHGLASDPRYVRLLRTAGLEDLV